MNSYIARQPIFDASLDVAGYELLYRDGEQTQRAQFTDGNTATSRLLSDAITVFGLPSLTDAKPAFVNFTEKLLLGDFVYLAPPREVVIEVLEDVRVNELLVEKLSELRGAGYRLALDDYTGSPHFEAILPLIHFLKVDFMLTDEHRQAELAHLAAKYPNLQLLAEKVETEEEFLRAKEQGYSFFQGYFFARPKTLKKKVPSLSTTSYALILQELNRRDGIDFSRCANAIHQDALLTYRILQRIQTLEYYRGNMITAVRNALVMMGETEVRRWLLLMMARDNNVTPSDELVREAYLRGVFSQLICESVGRRELGDNAFLLGMLSMLDIILGISREELFQDVYVADEVRAVLLGEQQDTFYARLLALVCHYERGGRNTDAETLSLDGQTLARLYMKSVLATDAIFQSIAPPPG